MEFGKVAQARIRNITTPSVCSPVILGSNRSVLRRENVQKMELGVVNLLSVKVKIKCILQLLLAVQFKLFINVNYSTVKA